MQPQSRTPFTPSATQFKKPENKVDSHSKSEDSTTVENDVQTSTSPVSGLNVNPFENVDALGYQARDQRRQFQNRVEIQPVIPKQKNSGKGEITRPSTETQSLTRRQPCTHYGTSPVSPVVQSEEKCIVM